ncbi:MAG: hypothetical protein N2C14_17155, partial [Planctomycetales bacterium]
RYFMRVISTQKDVQAGQVWLEAFPKYQQDAANFRKAEFILSRKDFLPVGLKLYLTNDKSEKTYVFRDTKINATRWIPEPVNPRYPFYKWEKREAPRAAAKPKPTTPRLLNLFRRKTTTTR